MKVSHEVPICMLEESRAFNDYDYALVHLFEKYPEYYSFFEESLKMGREVILDNSLYELGEAFNSEKYAEWIEKLNPTYYIIPDAFNDVDKNMTMCVEWMMKYGQDLDSKCIGVCHGNTYDEMVYNYNFIKFRVDKIAFSFMENAFKEFIEIPSGNHDMDMARAREKFIQKMLKENVIDKSIKHHLLGNYVPLEYYQYRDYKWIDSIDTSSPILAGINGIKYSENTGIEHKPKGKIIDYIDKDVKNKAIIMYNILKFKELIV